MLALKYISAFNEATLKDQGRQKYKSTNNVKEGTIAKYIKLLVQNQSYDIMIATNFICHKLVLIFTR